MRNHKHHYDSILKECDTCKPQNTPTPWEANKKGSTIHIESPGSGYTVALIESCTDLIYSQDEINAAFIVRVVNCHAELLQLIKEAYELNQTQHTWKSWDGRAKLAIAKAEGK